MVNRKTPFSSIPGPAHVCPALRCKHGTWPVYIRTPARNGVGSLHSRKNVTESGGRTGGLTKRVTSHTFRHSFATHLLADGYDIRTVQELPGHKDVRTTMIYTHVLNRGVRSPADGSTRDSGA